MDTIVDAPRGARAALVLAHGAGAGMRHPFLEAFARGLAARGVAVLRFDFPFMAAGSKRPDPPAVAQAAVREAVEAARERWPGLPCFAGGKSFGGRMASLAQAEAPLGVRGLVFVGFPLHPAGKPSTARAAHLPRIDVPLLFLQGTRDALARIDLARAVAGGLPGATCVELEGADHAFHVLRRSGDTDDAVRERMLEAAAGWMLARLGTRAALP